MTGKKISFTKKPTLQNANQFIDNWVTGDNNPPKTPDPELKRTTIYLPEELRKKLKLKAAQNDTTMTELIIASIINFL